MMKSKAKPERKKRAAVRVKRVVRPLHRDHKLMLRALGANIKAARLKTGITLPTLSKLSGVSKGNCSKVEHGGNVSALTLYKLCWSIGVHPREVLPEYRPNDPSSAPRPK
jgi:DNA-binding Xre family transcriptional regulator